MRLFRRLSRVGIVKLTIVAAAFGMSVGVGSYTFIYAKGSAYLLNDPAACANCHIMNEQYDGWLKSSHHSVATCNDCHTPEGFFAKYASKASNGFWHSFAFTTGYFDEPIQIRARNRKITESSCRKCHQEFVEATELNSEPISCLQCHRSVGHMH
ncbi:MAG: cytochrome c nitrite reductase small subunit [Blastocatellia bacterium]|nr:cytochrome c nitrite reductase small subunit [Blastocatellia bacterium]